MYNFTRHSAIAAQDMLYQDEDARANLIKLDHDRAVLFHRHNEPITMTTTLRNGLADVQHTSNMEERPKYVQPNLAHLKEPRNGITHATSSSRWWLPGSAVSYDTLKAQLESVKKAGFGGVEVAFLGNGGRKPGLRDEDKWADKDGKWKRMVTFIWRECERLGLSADLTIGPAFPAMVPGLSPDSPGSAKELVYGKSNGTYTPGDAVDLSFLPTATSTEAGRTPSNSADQHVKLNLLAVFAVRAVVNEEQSVEKEQGSMVIDIGEDGTYHDSVHDITEHAHAGAKFTFPDHEGKNSRWIVVAAYFRGTLQSKSHFEKNADTYTQELAHVVDHLSEDGVRVLAVSTLFQMIRRLSDSSSGVVFVYQEYYETHILDEDMKATFKRMRSNLFEDSLELSQTQYWTPALLQEFKQRRGYDLTRFLPLVLDEAKHHPFAPPFKTFKLSSSSEKVNRNGKSMQDRVRHDFALTISDLYLEKRLDPLKKWANSIGLALRNQPYGIDFDAAVAATKVDIVEGETLCFWGNDDSFRVLATGRDVAGGKILSEELAASMHKHYAMSWHDIIRVANRDFALGVNQVIMHGLPYPETEHSEWPGYMPFLPAGKLPGFGDAWGERQPQWTLSYGYTNYLQNVQHILQLGRAIVDIGIYHGATQGVKGGVKDTALSEAGYTYGFPSDGLLARNDAVVVDGKLWNDGPGYKALVLNDVGFIQISTFRQILQLAKQGLPIILVGNGPLASAGFNPSDDQSATNHDSEIAALLSELKNDENPSLKCKSAANPFLVAVREDNDHRYYYIHNTSDSKVKSIIQLDAPTYTDPAVLSLWDNNQPTPLPYTKSDAGFMEMDIQLPPKGSVIICLHKSSNGAVPVKQSSLPDAKSVSSEIELTEWKLDLESWEPSSKRDANSTTIDKRVKSISLKDGLEPLPELEGAKDISGIAVYQTSFEIPMDPQAADWRAVLELGGLDDAYDVAINDQPVLGVDRLQSRHDITDYLRPGENKLRITIGTTLNNRLKQVNPEMFDGRATQAHGIKGPVKLVLYT
ncbi:hypothetical protein QFC21_006317 [Naganishia friedmannii]|uniref:Uncharacterized protein n=1 Tax=Naganishia friedmannii TaxID=89922 RepID=A0ACC2V4F7_9TREE|nr:hypothetical protein QFC21_006317 [Naganishia friedmannii]